MGVSNTFQLASDQLTFKTSTLLHVLHFRKSDFTKRRERKYHSRSFLKGQFCIMKLRSVMSRIKSRSKFFLHFSAYIHGNDVFVTGGF
jgi:hypothetical protein